MNNRERFLKTMHFEKVDHPPFFMDGPWPDTYERWYKEGYPKGVDLADFLGVESLKMKHLGIDTFLIPPMEEKIEYEDDKIIIKTDHFGVKEKRFKDHTSMPEWLDHTIKVERDMLNLLERFNPDLKRRYPPNYDELLRQWKTEDDCVAVAGGASYYGILRNMLGVENFSLMLYDSPGTVKKWNEAYHRVIMTVLEKHFSEGRVDYVSGGEDLAYKTSSLISPEMYREFILPYHKDISRLARQHGCDLFFFDSDGNINELLPHFIEGGINILYPVECAADMNPVAIRKKYGKQICMIGGIDKREIAKGKEAIKREVFTKVTPLIEEGGFIPRIDHSVSADISLDNFVFYISLLKEIYGIK